MFSTRKQGPHPRPAVVATPAVRGETVVQEPRALEPPDERADSTSDQSKAARAGGFHESSYELRSGLEVSESEWPADTTIPGALGEH
jgi:hypothetical protein